MRYLNKKTKKVLFLSKQSDALPMISQLEEMGYKEFFEHFEAFVLASMLLSKSNKLSDAATSLKIPISTLSRRRQLLKDKIDCYWEEMVDQRDDSIRS